MNMDTGTALGLTALVLSGVHLVWALGRYIAGKTKNTVDDSVFRESVESVVVDVVGRLFPKTK